MEFAVVQNDDEVGALHRADPLGDDELGHIGELGQGMADARLGGSIHGAGGVIENQHLGVLEQGTGDAEALLLAARHVDAPLAQIGVQAVGHPVQELVGVGSPAGLPQLFIGGIGIAPFQIVPDGAGEEQVLLEHDAHGVPQGGQVVIPHIPAAHLHGAGGGVIEAGDQLDQGGLGGTGAADDAHGGTRRNVQGDVRQSVFLRLGVVFEADIFKVDGAVLDGGHRPGGVGQVGLFGEHLPDAAGAGQGPGHLKKDAGEHHDRVEHLEHIAEEGGELAHAHGTQEDEIAAEPHDADDGGVHDRLEGGHIQHGEAEGLGAGVAEFGVDLLKLLIFPVAPHKGFDDPDGSEAFLDAAVQMVHGALLAAVERSHLADDPAQHDGQDGGSHQKDHGQPGAEDKGHAQPHEQHDRAAYQRPQAGVHGVEEHGGVGGHTGDQGGSGEPVQVGKVELLDGGVFGQAQFRRKAVGIAGGKPGIEQAGDQGQHGAEGHENALAQDDGHIVGGHALVDEGGHKYGNDHLTPAFQDQQKHRYRKVLPVGFAVPENQPKILHRHPSCCVVQFSIPKLSGAQRRLSGSWLATMAANISTQPASSVPERVCPRMTQPARALKTLSRHMARLAMVGSSSCWPTICRV